MVRSYFRLCSFTAETMVLCQLCLSCSVWYQPNLGFTCHVNYDCRCVRKYLSSLGDCPIWKSAVKFENSSISLNITESFHQHSGKINPVSDVTVVNTSMFSSVTAFALRVDCRVCAFVELLNNLPKLPISLINVSGL